MAEPELLGCERCGEPYVLLPSSPYFGWPSQLCPSCEAARVRDQVLATVRLTLAGELVEGREVRLQYGPLGAV